LEPWKSRNDPDLFNRRFVLQWGHGDGAVEEAGVAGVTPGTFRLQWGHGDGAVEEALMLTQVSACSRFNGATAMEPWKRPARAIEPLAGAELQWGHGDGAVEEAVQTAPRAGLRWLQWGHGDGAVEESKLA